MMALQIIVDGDDSFGRLFPGEDPLRLGEGTLLAVTGLAGGMQSGVPSVGLFFRLRNGRLVYAETSLKLFLTAADALRARHGDPRGG